MCREPNLKLLFSKTQFDSLTVNAGMGIRKIRM